MTAVAVEGVWKFFGDYPALKDLNLTVDQGTCLALIGRNGAGKTTLLRILSGLTTASKGNITLMGQPARQLASRRRIGWIGHGIGVYDELSALENLTLFARIYNVEHPTKTARQWLERTGLLAVENSPVREFSRGMRQRVALSRAFLHDPEILLLDEPFTSLDDRAIALLQSLVNDALHRGATAVMSTHQLRESMDLATHVALLNRGKLTFTGARTVEMLADPGWVYRHYGEME